MSRHLNDLEVVLDQMIAEHAKLVTYVEAHQGSMRRLDLPGMDAARAQQDACRKRIAAFDARRLGVMKQLMQLHKLTTEPTLTQIAELYPAHAESLMARRAQLRELAGQLVARTHVAGKLAGAVLGHLNTVVRAIAGAVEHAGVYTKNGNPRVSERIGVLEATG